MSSSFLLGYLEDLLDYLLAGIKRGVRGSRPGAANLGGQARLTRPLAAYNVSYTPPGSQGL